MPSNVCIPLIKDGDDFSGRVITSPVVGKTFADIGGDMSSGPGLAAIGIPGTYDGTNFQVVTAPAGSHPIGVFAYDGAVGALVPLLAGSKKVPVTVGANVTAGQEVQVGANGKAIPLGAEVLATLLTGVVGSNNALTFTSRKRGASGNNITVTMVDPGGTTASLSVDTAGDDITISLARASSALSSTATQVIAAILAHDEASQLVTATNTSSSSGAGIVAAVSKTSLAGGVDATSEGLAVGKAFTTATTGNDAIVGLYL